LTCYSKLGRRSGSGATQYLSTELAIQYAVADQMVAYKSRLIIIGGVNESGFCEDPMIGFHLKKSTGTAIKADE
jgi:hypothetical protein